MSEPRLSGALVLTDVTAPPQIGGGCCQLFLSMSLFWNAEIGWRSDQSDNVGLRPTTSGETYASFAWSLIFIEGNSKRVRDAVDTALNPAAVRRCAPAIAANLALSICSIMADVAGALEFALRSAVVAKTGDPDDAAIADSLLGAAYHSLGGHVRSQRHSERALRSSPGLRRFNQAMPVRSELWRFIVFPVHSGSLVSDQALRYAEMAIEEAEKSGRSSCCVARLSRRCRSIFG